MKKCVLRKLNFTHLTKCKQSYHNSYLHGYKLFIQLQDFMKLLLLVQVDVEVIIHLTDHMGNYTTDFKELVSIIFMCTLLDLIFCYFHIPKDPNSFPPSTWETYHILNSVREQTRYWDMFICILLIQKWWKVVIMCQFSVVSDTSKNRHANVDYYLYSMQCTSTYYIVHTI